MEFWNPLCFRDLKSITWMSHHVTWTHSTSNDQLVRESPSVTQSTSGSGAADGPLWTPDSPVFLQGWDYPRWGTCNPDVHTWAGVSGHFHIVTNCPRVNQSALITPSWSSIHTMTLKLCSSSAQGSCSPLEFYWRSPGCQFNNMCTSLDPFNLHLVLITDPALARDSAGFWMFQPAGAHKGIKHEFINVNFIQCEWYITYRIHN